MTQADIIIDLMVWAVVLTGYQVPDEMPIIHYRPHEYFVVMVCDGVDTKTKPCSDRALYNDAEDGIIVLNTKYWQINKVWTPWETGIILHEMVHYLQDMSGRYVELSEEEICEARHFRQVEAYTTQDKYLRVVFGHRRIGSRYYDGCGH